MKIWSILAGLNTSKYSKPAENYEFQLFMTGNLSRTEIKLLDLLADSDILVDELYHLQNFQSVSNYNPSPEQIILNKDSVSLRNFKNDFNLDIWPQANRRSTRKVATDNNKKLSALREKLDANIDDKIIEKLASRNQKRCKKRKPTNSEHQLGQAKRVKPKEENDERPVKLKLKLSVKPQTVTHPEHIPSHNFSSVSELFNSYRHPIEDPAPELEAKDFDDYLNNQTILINKLKHAINDKHLLYVDYSENPFRQVPNGVKEPTMIKKNQNYHINSYKPAENPFRMKNELTHYDHLLAQGMRSSKLIHDLRSTKLQKCRRISQMIEVHFKRLSQEKEKQEKEFKKRMVKIARETAKEVKKKWLVAVKAYKILEEREKEQERLAKSKQQLSKILDHSTKVLGAQLVGKPSNDNVVEVEDTKVESEHQSGDEEINTSDDERFSSSSDEEEGIDKMDEDGLGHNSDNNNDGKNNVSKSTDEDSKLSIDELREKYKDLASIGNGKGVPNSTSSLAKLYQSEQKHKVGIVDQLTPAERMEILKENSHDPVLNEESSDSTSLTDDDSDNLSSSSSMVMTDDESDGESHPGLSALFTHKGINNTSEEENDDQDDDSVYSENNDVETPSSSPEHSSHGDHDAVEQVDDNGIPNVPIPILLKGKLRPYQKQGLNWLASLYNNGTNGILADEMGLGKTIQTISLLAYLACEKNEWGPHLIVVPTSVMLNWEMEFKRFAPGFKVLTYYGSPQQRKEKRKGWNTPDTFHVCITSYQLVVHDQPIFRRKKWKYMILDEAHNIKNFRSQRWKALLNFNTEHRLLLTGTPLQNNIMELWSLLYFLMPSSKEGNITMPEGFADLMDFQQWFGKPVDKIIQQGANDLETRETVNKLHQVLRPYLLRRLKQDVEKQMPAKYEHIIHCRLSKRQRLLYDDFMSRAKTKETLASGNFLSIINCLMQLRKVCNHPDLFEVRPILTSFAQEKSVASQFEIKDDLIRKMLRVDGRHVVDLMFLNLVSITKYTGNENSYHMKTIGKLSSSDIFDKTIANLRESLADKSIKPNFDDLHIYYEYVLNKENNDLLELMQHRKYVNDFNCNKSQLISSSLVDILSLKQFKTQSQLKMLGLTKSIGERSFLMKDVIEKYAFITPKAVCNNMNELTFPVEVQKELMHDAQNNILENPFHQVQVKTSIAFPDKSLLQYDCGKLQKLAQLLQNLIPQGHRVLIFTQMSKVLDILELFLNYHGYTYMRLDGATRIEDRQLLTERFNNDNRVKCFILSTRAGGLGINLTGADTVVFYDSDWNPAIDKQCQDRCHRIGQTRDVHIYRFVSEYTIEANILKKAEQKKHLDNVIIQNGDFTTDYFSKMTVQELLGNPTDEDTSFKDTKLSTRSRDFTKALEMAEDEDDAKAAEIAMKETNIDVEDFSDDEKNTKVPDSSNEVNGGSNVDGKQVEELTRRIEKRETDRKGGDNERSGDHPDDVMDIVEDMEEDDGIGHIDEYMIRFIAGGYYFD